MNVKVFLNNQFREVIFIPKHKLSIDSILRYDNENNYLIGFYQSGNSNVFNLVYANLF